MATQHPQPPLDPEAGKAWRAMSDKFFDGRSATVTDDSLEEVRNFQMIDLNEIASERPFKLKEIQISGEAES